MIFGARVGNKKDNVTIIYTPWANLHKNAGMATGQVGFRDPKRVGFSAYIYIHPSPSLSSPSNTTRSLSHGPTLLHYTTLLQQSTPVGCSPVTKPQQTKKTLVPTRLNPTINRLEKTRRARPVDDLPADKEAHLARQRATKRAENERRQKEEDGVARERREEKERREKGYEDLMAEGGRSNEEGFDEDDFM